tara:strand:+ start:670 stop:864 length:195 start_codon:yes stop_codon:yes gene_type:complete
MSDKVKQVSKTTQGETNSSTQQSATSKAAESIKEPSEVTSVQKEDIAFQIQFTIPVRGGLGSST